MDANELMIGDWVLYNEEPIKVFNVHDSSINETYCGCSNDVENFINDFDLKPIPITAEILEKNEFYHEHNVGLVYEDGYGAEVIYSTFDNELRIIRDRDVILRKQELWMFPIHELQHALRLAGIKKEIVL